MRIRNDGSLALVLGGGGAKGAYEIGAIAALNELGVIAGRVYGTSVGSINAAFYAQGSMEMAETFWDTMRISDVIGEDSLAIAEDLEDMFGHPDKLLDFVSKYAHRKGLDISPLIRILTNSISEDAIRRSPVRLGLVTTRFPSMDMVEMPIDRMEQGSLIDWILASSACFPLFPMQPIGSARYIDGGFCDNTPVEMAIRNGAEQIIAIDIGKHRAHQQYDKRPNILYIRTSRPLGGLLTFDPERSRRNRRLGYLDTLRAFGKLKGSTFFFDVPEGESSELADRYVIGLTRFEASLKGSNALTRKDDAPLFALLDSGLPPQPQSIDYLLRGCELCGEIAGLDELTVYTPRSFAEALRGALPLERAGEMLESLLGGRISILFSGRTPDRKLIISCLYRLLSQDQTFSPLAMKTLVHFRQEMLCALTLRVILGDP